MTMSRVRLYLTTLATVLALAAGGLLAGCGSDDTVDYPPPATWTTTFQGQCYVGYQYDPHEVDMYGSVPVTCIRVLYPSFGARVLADTVEAALLLYLTGYSGFYHSGYWYDQYYRPMGARYHVTVVDKRSFTSNATSFTQRYAADIKANSAKVTYKGGKPGNYVFPSSNDKARNKAPVTNVDAAGKKDPGTTNSRTGTGTTTTGGKTGTSGGKTGTTSRTGRR